ncbi:MAG TPA: methyltransferase, partial [Stellaceae bacterium]|nr:methyltransferase [Stellaceae bacterium]
MLTSLVCKYEHFRSDWYARWSHALGYPPAVEILETGGSHRKVWEWCAISQALEERGMLQPGKVGLGFAVGQEPLSSAFAARGVRVLATDRPQEGDPDGWSATGQHAASLDVLFKENLIGKREFDDRV